jgi:putative peptidoglycan lipid II flippase
VSGQGESGQQPGDDAAPLGGRRLGAAALLLAASVLLSRVMGLVRNVVLAGSLGVGRDTDAYGAAFFIPDLLNYLLAGGALTIAFTPLYLKTLRGQGDAEADTLFRTVLGSLGAITVLLTLGLWLYAEPLVAVIFGDFDADKQALTVQLTRIVLPAQVFFVSGGIVRAVLMAHGRFGAQAAAPLLYNGGIIAGGLTTGTLEGFAWGALVGALLGGFVYPIFDMRHVRRVGIRVAPWDVRFHTYLWVARPLMLGLSITTVDEWYEKYFGARLGEGVLAALVFARQLMMAPVAVIGQAVATAALPTLSALHADGREEALHATLERTLRGTLVLAVIVAAGIHGFAEPIVDAIYRRGAFDAEASSRVAGLLAILALAIPGWVTQQVAIRGFFARAEMWRAMLLGTGVALAVIPVYMALGERQGAAGLAWAGVLAITANAILTVIWARVRFGGPALGPLLETAVRSIVVGVLAAAAGRLGAGSAALSGGVWFQLVVGGIVFLLVAGPGIRLLGDSAMRETVAGLASRLTGGRASQEDAD